MDSTVKFTGKATIYSKYRPGYPKEYMDYLAAYSRLPSDAVIADIGSGTGIFSRQLLERGFRVIAVEPNDDMRSAAENNLSDYPGYFSKKGTAENTGIPAGRVDLVTAAQSFHWFDAMKFKAECSRILKPDSNVALVWNSRDSSSELIMENAEICKKFCSQFYGFSGGIEETPDVYRQFFRDGKYDKKEFQHNLKMSLDGFIGRNLSSSYAPKVTDPDYGKFIEAITGLFAKYSKDDEILVPNITRSYIGKV